MPDNIKGFGTKAALGLPAEGLSANQNTLLRFKPTQNADKKINDRSTLDVTENEEIKRAQNEKAATDFEALLLQQMIQSMWKTVPTEGLLSGSNEEAMYRDMLSEQYAHELAKNQSFGLKDAVLGEMVKKTKE